MNQQVPALVLDEHLMGLRKGLELRGLDARTVEEFRATSTLDPDVIRAISDGMGVAPWILLTMDLTIIDDHKRFEWERYAIAWIVIESHLRGIAVENAKTNVVQRHAHVIVEQRPGDHFTVHARSKAPNAPVARKRSQAFGPVSSVDRSGDN